MRALVSISICSECENDRDCPGRQSCVYDVPSGYAVCR